MPTRTHHFNEMYQIRLWDMSICISITAPEGLPKLFYFDTAEALRCEDPSWSVSAEFRRGTSVVKTFCIYRYSYLLGKVGGSKQHKQEGFISMVLLITHFPNKTSLHLAMSDSWRLHIEALKTKRWIMGTWVISSGDTVDGRNPAPPGMYKTRYIMG